MDPAGRLCVKISGFDFAVEVFDVFVGAEHQEDVAFFHQEFAAGIDDGGFGDDGFDGDDRDIVFFAQVNFS